VWKIERGPGSECSVLRLSGRIQGDHLGELGSFLEAESNGQPLVLDLAGVKLVDHEVVSFLANRESAGVKLRNCPAYIREWINRL
jgi:ABC-type transporter Mla MlaB component